VSSRAKGRRANKGSRREEVRMMGKGERQDTHLARLMNKDPKNNRYSYIDNIIILNYIQV